MRKLNPMKKKISLVENHLPEKKQNFHALFEKKQTKPGHEGKNKDQTKGPSYEIKRKTNTCLSTKSSQNTLGENNKNKPSANTGKSTQQLLCIEQVGNPLKKKSSAIDSRESNEICIKKTPHIRTMEELYSVNIKL